MHTNLTCTVYSDPFASLVEDTTTIIILDQWSQFDTKHLIREHQFGRFHQKTKARCRQNYFEFRITEQTQILLNPNPNHYSKSTSATSALGRYSPTRDKKREESNATIE